MYVSIYISGVEPFKAEYISESVLKRLLKEYIVKEHFMRNEEDEENYIYKEGQPCDYFVLILQGLYLKKFLYIWEEYVEFNKKKTNKQIKPNKYPRFAFFSLIFILV